MSSPTDDTHDGPPPRPVGRAHGRARYGTWIRPHRIAGFVAATVACLVGCVVVPWPWSIPMAAAAVLTGYIASVIGLSAWRFSDRGSDMQARIHALIVNAVAPAADERLLDIGCGSGALTMALAAAQTEAHVTGVDLWGDDWQYSQQQAESNAVVAGHDRRTTFARHSASALPFVAEFDAIASSLTFHEVRDAPSATAALVGALRTLRPGGRFVILDLFGARQHYASVHAVVEEIERHGATVHAATSLGEMIRLPFPLAQRQVLGDAVMIVGQRDA
jgi:2-polyprenyl-3-methyl-5-hydroxy-6-metoxy-1,4-benzoquinol methylase